MYKAHIQLREHVLNHVEYTVATQQPELDHTDHADHTDLSAPKDLNHELR